MHFSRSWVKIVNCFTKLNVRIIQLDGTIYKIKHNVEKWPVGQTIMLHVFLPIFDQRKLVSKLIMTAMQGTVDIKLQTSGLCRFEINFICSALMS